MKDNPRVRYFEQRHRRGAGGRFVTGGGTEFTARHPRPPSKQSGLPRYIELKSGARVLTTGPDGRRLMPMLSLLRDQLAAIGLKIPDVVPVQEVKDAYDGAIPEAWVGEEKPEELEAPPSPAPRRAPRPVRREKARVSPRRERPAVRAPRRRAARVETRVRTVRRDASGRFNSRGRTVQKITYTVRRKR